VPVLLLLSVCVCVYARVNQQLVEFATFIALHAPPTCSLTRPSHYVKDVLDVAQQKGGGDLAKAQEVSVFMTMPLGCLHSFAFLFFQLCFRAFLLFSLVLTPCFLLHLWGFNEIGQTIAGSVFDSRKERWLDDQRLSSG